MGHSDEKTAGREKEGRGKGEYPYLPGPFMLECSTFEMDESQRALNFGFKNYL